MEEGRRPESGEAQALVQEASWTLLSFVHERLGSRLFPAWFSKKVARFRIGDGCVKVNGQVERFLHRSLEVGDVVSIDARRVRAQHAARRSSSVSGAGSGAVETRDDAHDEDGIRLLDILHHHLGLSLSASRRALRAGRVTLRGRAVDGAAQRVAPSEWCHVAVEEEVKMEVEVMVQHEDSDLLVLWKPVDVAINDLVMAAESMTGATLTKVSRLEAWASGLLLLAKTPSFAAKLRRILGESDDEEVIQVEDMLDSAVGGGHRCSCHFLFLVACGRSMPTEPWCPPGLVRIQELRPWSSNWWNKNQGQMQILECICPCPAPGTKLLASMLTGLGYTLLGRKGLQGGRPMKCIIGWNLLLGSEVLSLRGQQPEGFSKALEKAKDGWQRHCQVFGGARCRGRGRFCGHDFLCGDTMVPRLGTESIAGAAAREMAADRPTLLDLGTGSGCIALSALLALHSTTCARAVGVDVSDPALSCARENGRRLLPDNKVFHAQKLCFSELWKLGECLDLKPSAGFDVVVSNPPYLTHREAKELCQLEEEPWHCFTLKRSQEITARIAACEQRSGDLDGAIAVYAIIFQAIRDAELAGQPLLKPGGALILEVPSTLEQRVKGVAGVRAAQNNGTSEEPRCFNWHQLLRCFAFGVALPAAGRGVVRGLRLERRLMDENGVFRGLVFRKL